MEKYLRTWWTVMLRPIYFYTRLKEEDWKKDATSFTLMTAWILAFFTTLIIFILHYIPIGSTLVEQVHGLRLLVVMPVLLVLIFMFFLITFLIVGGVLAVGLLAAMLMVGYVLHYVYVKMGGKGSLNRMLQSMLYSNAIFLGGILILLLTLLTKYGGMDFQLFRAGYDFFYFLALIYVYGLWAVAGKKNYGISKRQAFIGAIIPFVVLLIFGVLFDKIMLPRLQSWIS